VRCGKRFRRGEGQDVPDRREAGLRGRNLEIVAVLCGWILIMPLSAESFALRGLDKGDSVPDMEFMGITAESGKLSSFSGGKGLIVIYWATWSSRSPMILEFAEKELRRYEEHGVKLLAINADHQEMRREEIEAVKGKATEMALSKIVDLYPGFPSIARDDIPDRIDAFLGIEKKKRPEKSQYLLDHKPKNHALQYYNLGKMMFTFARSPSGDLKGAPESAIERLDEAIRRDPDFFRPYLLKTIIFDMAGDEGRRDAVLTELSEHFATLLAQVPDDPGVLFGQAVSSAKRGDGASARKALDALRKNPRAAEDLGFDFAPLFTDSGDLAPGSEGDLRLILERLLEIKKKSQGTIRKDAPVQPDQSPLPSSREAPGSSPAGTR
jgi:hypothetical protein